MPSADEAPYSHQRHDEERENEHGILHRGLAPHRAHLQPVGKTAPSGWIGTQACPSSLQSTVAIDIATPRRPPVLTPGVSVFL